MTDQEVYDLSQTGDEVQGILDKGAALPSNPELQAALSGKQDVITDLSTIRQNAQKGQEAYEQQATVVQQAAQAVEAATDAEHDAQLAQAAALAAAGKLEDLETFLQGLDPESAASVAAELGLFEQEVRENYAKKTECVFDISAYHATGTPPVLAIYANLEAALGTDGENVPEALRTPGMSVKFVQGTEHSSDNKYVQYRLTATTWSTVVTDWEGEEIKIETTETDLSFSDKNGYDIVQFSGGHVKTKNFDSEHPDVSLGESDVDLSLSDDRGNDVLQIVGGNVKTKHFDSRQNAETLNYLQQEIDEINYEGNLIACIGDSLTYQTGSVNYLGEDVPVSDRYRYAAWMGTKNPNYTFIPLAVGGEDSVTILGRMGSVPMVIDEDITLPADGSNVAVILKSSWINSNNEKRGVSPLVGGSYPAEQINPCYIDGIACTLTRSNDIYYIHRNEVSESSDVILKGSCIKTYNSYHYNPKVMVFWIGTNDNNIPADELIAKIKQTVDYFNTDKFVVVSRHYLTETYTLSVAQEYEAKYQDAFGDKFLNWRYYCSKRGIYDAIDRGYIDNTQGTYPTAGDLEDMAAGTVPRTLRHDVVHLVLEGNKLVGDLIYKRLEDLNYV